MAQLHWLVTVSLVALSWIDIGTDVFAITQYAALAQQQYNTEWTCSNNNQMWLSSWSKLGRHQSNSIFKSQSCPTATNPSAFQSPPYQFAFWMCLYLTAGLCVGHLLLQAVIAMCAVRHSRRAEYADECLSCSPVLPYLTAFARGLVMWEPAYQFLNMHSPPNDMDWQEAHAYGMHAQQVFMRLRLAEAVLKGPCVTVAMFALILQALARSSNAELYLSPVATGTGAHSKLPLTATVLSVAIGVLSLAVFATTYAMSQRQSLWGSPRPAHCRGCGPAVGSAVAIGVYSLCSIGSRSLAGATAVAAIMLDDSIAEPAYWLAAACVGALVVLGWAIYATGSCWSVSRSCHCFAAFIKAAICSLLSVCTVNIPWNTAAAACRKPEQSVPSDNEEGPAHTAQTDAMERTWWPSVAVSVLMCAALLSAGLVLGIVVGSTATCYAACNGNTNGRGGPGGYIFFSAACGVVISVLAVWELLLFAVLSRTAPPRAADDDWDDDFIEIDPQDGKA